MRLAPFRGAQVLLSGCTGFVGKVALQELMRRKEELGVDTVYILSGPRRTRPRNSAFLKMLCHRNASRFCQRIGLTRSK